MQTYKGTINTCVSTTQLIYEMEYEIDETMNEIEETKKITVVASYKGFTKEFTIEVTLLTAMDVINDLNNAKKEYIEGLFK